MTRINANLDPTLLTDQHLMAEYRELPMVYAALRRSLRSPNGKNLKSRIPEKFTLNGGHVTYFYDKLTFLVKRYSRLIVELKSRQFDIDESRVYDLSEFPIELHNDWTATDADNSVIIQRIREKILMKPKWYRYKRQALSTNYETLRNVYGEISFE